MLLHAKRIHFKMIDLVINPENNSKINQIDPKINQNNQKIDQSNQMIDQINPKINQNNQKNRSKQSILLSCGLHLYYDDRSWIDPLQLFTFFADSRLQQPIIEIFMSAASKSFQFVVARYYFCLACFIVVVFFIFNTKNNLL